MTHSSGSQPVFISYNEMKIRFRVMPPPLLDEKLKAAVNALSLLPDCLSYRLSEQRYRFFHWSICGVWVSDEAKNRHYTSDHLQTLMQLLMRSDVSVISFSEADTQCLPQAHPHPHVGPPRWLTGRIRNV